MKNFLGAVLLLLFSSDALHANESIQSNNVGDLNTREYLESETPLYTQFKWSKNYLVNQPIINLFRWSAVFAVAGLSVGHFIYLGYKQNTLPYWYGMSIGSTIGGVAGLGIGFKKGLKLYRLEKKRQSYSIT